MSWLQEIDAGLADLSAKSLLRQRRPVRPEAGARLNVDGVSLLAFCSNDHLCPANDPLLRQAVPDAVDRYGVGAGASPKAHCPVGDAQRSGRGRVDPGGEIGPADQTVERNDAGHARRRPG